MADKRSLLDTLHDTTHRVPGVVHENRPAGHHGDTHRGRTGQTSTTGPRSHHKPRKHSQTRSPRVLVAWQRRIAAIVGQEL